MQNFITYDGLPISSGGAHKVNGYSATELYNSLSYFIDNFTDADKPSLITIQFNSTKNGNDNRIKTIWNLILACGLPKISLPKTVITKGVTGRQVTWTWVLKNGSINKALKLQHQYKNVTFSVRWCFSFADPTTKAILQGQDLIPIIDPRLYNSQIYWRYGKSSTVSLWFTLPFSELDTNATNYIKLLQANFPVKLSRHHWRLWRTSKNGPSPKKLLLDFLE